MKRQRGFNLIELTLAMAISATVIFQVLNLFTEKLASHTLQVNQLRLNQETRAIMNLISADIKRHGYWNNDDIVDNPHSSLVLKKNCIILSYDKNKDGALDTKTNETIGYRLVSGKIQTRNGPSDCNSGRWESLNDAELVVIDDFQIKGISSQDCINLSHAPYSNCNPYDCTYRAYTSGDHLLQKFQIESALKAHFSNDNRLNVELKEHISLSNPIITKTQQDGPKTPHTSCI